MATRTFELTTTVPVAPSAAVVVASGSDPDGPWTAWRIVERPALGPLTRSGFRTDAADIVHVARRHGVGGTGMLTNGARMDVRGAAVGAGSTRSLHRPVPVDFLYYRMMFRPGKIDAWSSPR